MKFGNLPPEEVQRRRNKSIEAMKDIKQKEFDEWYQEKMDAYYWKHGPSCAGCDHWSSEQGLVGYCLNSKIMSGVDVAASMGIISSSAQHMPPSYATTKHDYKCGNFKDEFDWTTLSTEYLKKIGARL